MKINIRALVVVLFIALMLILSIPFMLIAFVAGYINMGVRDRIAQIVIKVIANGVSFLCGTTRTVIGLDRIPKDEAVLFVGNHRSYFDIVQAYVLIPNLTGFVAKKEMNRVPLMNFWMRYLHCLFLDRNDIKQGMQTILKAIELIKSGICIFIFPEGTRSPKKEMLPFKGGSLKIAEKSGCPIVPVAFSNTGDILEDHMGRIYPKHIVIEFGNPIYPNELSKEEKKFLSSRVQGLIQDMLNKNEALI